MKRLLSILCVGLLALGCSEDFLEEYTQYPSLSPHSLYLWVTDLTFDNVASQRTIDITAESTPWSIQNDVTWIHTDKQSGDTSAELVVSVDQNTSGDDVRTGIFYVKSTISDFPASVPVSVMQSGASPTIGLSTYSVSLDSQHPTTTVSVIANCTWEYTCDATWLQVTRSGDNLQLTATEENMGTSARSTSVQLSHSGTTKAYATLTVTQQPATVTVSTDALTVPAEGGVYDFKFSCAGKWEIKTTYTYINVTPSIGSAGEHTVRVEVAPSTSTSSRAGNFTIYVEGVARNVIKVNQTGQQISLSKANLYFDAIGGEESVIVTSSAPWKVSYVPTWIGASPSTGVNQGTLKLKAPTNMLADQRVDNVKVSIEGTTVQASTRVIQYGNSQDISRHLLEFGPASSTQKITVQSAIGWKATTTDSWITVSPTESTTATEISITVAANASEVAREGTVQIQMGSKTETLTVQQQGNLLELSGSLDFTSKGGPGTFSLTANGTWELSLEDNINWITLSTTGGEGSQDISITCADNPTITPRSTALLVKSDVGQTLRLPITQAGRYLRVDHTELLFYASGGTSETVIVETDGAFKVSTSYMWLTVNQTGNSFTVTCLKNEGDQPRTGKVLVELTDLRSGSYQIELNVTQLEQGGTFHREDYGTDEDYDNAGSSTTTFDFIPYSSDTNYDVGAAASGFSVRKRSTQLKAAPVVPLVKQSDK